MLASRRLRGPAVNGNPLRRPIDRWESRVKAILIIAYVIAGPLLAWQAGTAGYHRTVRSATEMRQDRYPVNAVLVTDAVDDDQARDVAAPAHQMPVRVRWTGPDGTEHSESIVADNPARKPGDVVRIWTDVHGNAVAAPATRGKAVGNGIGVGLITVLATVALSVAAYALVGRVFQRRRLRYWDRDWLRVEPAWSGRP
jgi:hypothetical protein